jgi:hypothetical protein
MINLKLPREDEEREKFATPEELLLLVPFASPREGEAAYLADVTVGHGGEVVESKGEAEKKLEDLPVDPGEDDLIEVFENDKGLLSCLVLVPKEDGTYERIATLTEMSFVGLSQLKKHVQRELEIR